MTTPVAPIPLMARSFLTKCRDCGCGLALCSRPMPHRKFDRHDVDRGYLCIECQDAAGLEPLWAYPKP